MRHALYCALASCHPNFSLSYSQALRKLLQSKSGLVSSSSHSVTRGNEFSQLLQKMVQSTATTIRTVSRLARERGGEEQGGGRGLERGGEQGGGGGLEGVKLRLESQLAEAEDEVYMFPGMVKMGPCSQGW